MATLAFPVPAVAEPQQQGRAPRTSPLSIWPGRDPHHSLEPKPRALFTAEMDREVSGEELPARPHSPLVHLRGEG